MTRKQKVVRDCGDPTRDKIIEAAKDIFAERGYDGASMSQIAKLAGVNKSLIFHHFTDKENLWRSVKGSFSDVTMETLLQHIDIDSISLDDFIRTLLEARYKLYYENPRLVRMIRWQVLANRDDLAGTNLHKPRLLSKYIARLQERNLITDKYNAEMLQLLITTSIMPLFYYQIQSLQSKQSQKKYVEMAIETMIKALS